MAEASHWSPLIESPWWRFTLKHLLLAIAVVAVGLVALRNASSAWVAALFAVTYLTLASALLLAVFRRGGPIGLALPHSAGSIYCCWHSATSHRATETRRFDRINWRRRVSVTLATTGCLTSRSHSTSPDFQFGQPQCREARSHPHLHGRRQAHRRRPGQTEPILRTWPIRSGPCCSPRSGAWSRAGCLPQLRALRLLARHHRAGVR
jgi:hypothetical protein